MDSYTQCIEKVSFKKSIRSTTAILDYSILDKANQVLLTYYLHGRSLNLLTFSNNMTTETISSTNFFSGLQDC